jgi:hypothetical protein
MLILRMPHALVCSVARGARTKTPVYCLTPAPQICQAVGHELDVVVQKLDQFSAHTRACVDAQRDALASIEAKCAV